jgi:predicted nuclease of predicted toxin-antitoxin system
MATGLGIRIHLDENVDVRLADALNQRGYDATTALGQGWLHLSDEDQLRHATAIGRAIVSHDFDDFPRIHAEFLQRGEGHEGIILVPVRSLSELLTRISRHLDQHSPGEQRNNLFWA